jgi:hypothetical protein
MFDRTKRRFPSLRKESPDGDSLVRLDLAVQVDKPPREQFRKRLSDRGLAATHEPCECHYPGSLGSAIAF